MNVFILDTVEECFEKIKEHEDETSTKFVVRSVRSKDFGKADLYSKKGNSFIQWYDTLPYIYMNQFLFDCKYGPDRHVAFKKRLSEKRLSEKMKGKNENNQVVLLDQNTTLVASRKLGCPVKITVKEIYTFPEYILSSNTMYYKTKVSKDIRFSLQKKEAKAVKKFILMLPNELDHQMHPNLEEVSPVKPKRIRKKAKKLDADSVTEKSVSTKDARFREMLAEIGTMSYEINDGIDHEIHPIGENVEIYQSVDERITKKPKKRVNSATGISSKKIRIREMLAEIRTKAYEINEGTVLDSLKGLLELVLKFVSGNTSIQEGHTAAQTIEISPSKKRKRSKNQEIKENREAVYPVLSTV